jgi:CRISPR/Cas system CMR subunit Cmr6 (Cas7 group RAMP superfamily)
VQGPDFYPQLKKKKKKEEKMELDVVTHMYNPSAQKAEARGS